MEKGTALFLKMWVEWRSKIPKRLANEDPDMLIRLLELGGKDSGVLQSEAKRELGVNQPRLSKLMKKLLLEGWIKIEKSKVDGRRRPMKTTRKAEEYLSSLKEGLTGLQASSGPRAGRGRQKESETKPELRYIWDGTPDEDGSAGE